jgi:2-polyprenyl-3-methyl-5-hydroxy-6-metoxy-1,4-benzoquinol methylase
LSLSLATLNKRALGFGPGLVDCQALKKLRGKRFDLPADDPFVQRSDGDDHAYLRGASEAWLEHPEYMDYLDPDSPVHALKQAERDLVLHHWWPFIQGGSVLDVGCGIGRFTLPLLDRGYDVVGVDADLESLRRLAWHAAGRNGALDLHWSSAHTLPSGSFDVVIAAEVLCYVPDLSGALQAIRKAMAPGARLLLSMEARYGWALSADAPFGALDAALDGDGIVSTDGERWVHTFDEASLRAVLQQEGFRILDLRPSHWLTDGPLEAVMPESMTLEELVAADERCAKHPVFGPLNRLWLVAAEVRQ